MKIISKFKDFYDYNSMYDTDESIVYNRERVEYLSIDWIDKIIEELGLVGKDKEFIKESLGEYSDICLNKSRILKDRKDYDTYIGFLYSIIGIYPNVYILPVLCKFNLDRWGGINKVYTIYSYNDISSYFSVDTFEKIKKENEGMEYVRCTGRKKNKKPVIDMRIKGDYQLIGDEKLVLKSPSDLVKENREIFKKLKSPVFYVRPNGYRTGLILNPCLVEDVKLESIQDLAKDGSIYNRIEEFLIEMSVKDIPQPDNNTKIKNAGFDLKTSFRNM